MVKLIVLEMREGKGFLGREHETTPMIIIRKDMVFNTDANLQFIRYVVCNFVYFWCIGVSCHDVCVCVWLFGVIGTNDIITANGRLELPP